MGVMVWRIDGYEGGCDRAQLHGTSLLSYSHGGVVFELHSRVSGVQLSYHEGEASHISSWLR